MFVSQFSLRRTCCFQLRRRRLQLYCRDECRIFRKRLLWFLAFIFCRRSLTPKNITFPRRPLTSRSPLSRCLASTEMFRCFSFRYKRRRLQLSRRNLIFRRWILRLCSFIPFNTVCHAKVSPFLAKCQRCRSPISGVWAVQRCSAALCGSCLGFWAMHNQGNTRRPRHSLKMNRSGCIAGLFINIVWNIVTL